VPSTSAVAANLMSSPHFARYPSRPTDASCRCVQGAAETPVGLCTVVLAISVDFYGGRRDGQVVSVTGIGSRGFEFRCR